MKYYSNYRFPEGSRAFVDVTKPPYCVDNTGHTDCTRTLVRIIDDLRQSTIDGLRYTADLLENHTPEPTKWYASGVRKTKGVIQLTYPIDLVQVPTIYFPAGTYLVSDTLTYTVKCMRNRCYRLNINGTEINWCIRIMGEDRGRTVIKLQDNCPGFGPGGERAVICYMNAEWSNMAMSNYLENITIDTGAGNPAAIGVIFDANNSGSIRHVTIRSSDPDHCGFAGVHVKHDFVSACNVRDLEVDGFEYGLKIEPVRNFASLEDIRLVNQQRAGICVRDTPVSIRQLKFTGDRPGLYINGVAANVVLTASEFTSTGDLYEAIRIVRGCAMISDVTTKGFPLAVCRFWGQQKIPDGYISSYTTHEARTLFDGEARTLGLAVPPLPDVDNGSNETGCCVNDFGAAGDGDHDDTAAIAAAFSSGAEYVWFQPGLYRITSTIEIPATVKHINFSFCDISSGGDVTETKGSSVFRISGDSEKLLFIERLFTFEKCFGLFCMFSHECVRPLYLRDIHTQSCACYRNTVPGSVVYLENVACTIGNHNSPEHRAIPCFDFKGQTVWGHAINPERSRYETVNDGGVMWIHGFKAEQNGTIALTVNGGKTEILGGMCTHGGNDGIPCIENVDSSVSAVFSTGGCGNQVYSVIASETRNGKTRILESKGLPEREAGFFHNVPLYSGIKEK
ncbi:MAG: hypothetical protein IJU57_01460 [Clostridia bacterium]|nr:hypothetical protein [Clostridia bacterium]